MNPKSIEAFRAVMLTGSMTTAARDIHTTQPNVSRLISHLEYVLDMQLFERAGNKLTPTDEAVAFMVEVERYYLGLKTLAETASNIKRFGFGRCARYPLATDWPIARLSMPAILKAKPLSRCRTMTECASASIKFFRTFASTDSCWSRPNSLQQFAAWSSMT